MLKSDDRHLLTHTVSAYGELSSRELSRNVYVDHPFYAMNSQIIDQVLTCTEKQAVAKKWPVESGAKLFTIGYEGRSLERYLCVLLNNDIKLLCDVRKNAMSMKFGYSKSQLKNATSGLGIDYIHFPQLGIESYDRNLVKTDADFQQLLEYYTSVTLRAHEPTLLSFVDLASKYSRVALTCFEADHLSCHRSSVANAVENVSSLIAEIEHL